MEDELLEALKDFVATSNSGKYGNEKELLSKFPELQNYEASVLKDFVATSNSGKYENEEELLSKFPEFNTTVKKKEDFIGPELASDLEQKLPIPPSQDGSLATSEPESQPDTKNPKPTPEERISDLDYKQAELNQLQDNLADRDTTFTNILNYEKATAIQPEDAEQIEINAQEKLDGSTFEKFTQGAANVLSKIGAVATLGLGPDIKVPTYKERKQEKAIKLLEKEEKEQTPENLNAAIKQITIKDETDALRERRTIDYIGSLPEKEREELNVNQVFNYKTVEMEEKASVIDLEIDFEKLKRVASRVNSNEDFIRRMNEEGKELPEGFRETYTENFELRNQIVTNLDDKYKKFEEKLEQNQDKKIETTEAIDLIKRNYGFVDNMKAQIAMSTGDLFVAGSKGAFAYALNIKAAITGNESDQIASDEMAMSAEETKKLTQEVAETYRPRMEYDNVTGLEDVGYFMAQETATQVPIFAAMMNPFSATAGITALGISTGGSKFSEMKSEESGIIPANYSLLQEIAIPFGYGATESILGELPTFRILRRTVGTTAKRALIDKGALGFTKQFFKDNGIEVLTENATTFSQNLLDRFALDKKDVLLSDNLDKTTFSTLASSPLIIGGGKITGELIKPFMPKSQIEEIKSGYLKVIKLQKAYNNAGNQSTKNILEGKIKESNASNDKLIQKARNSTSNLSEAVYNKVNGITKKQALLQAEAKLINEDKALSKEQRTEILKDLLDEFNVLEKDRNEILEGKQLVVDEEKEGFLDLLTDKELLELKDKAQNEIIAEYEADGVKDFEITDQEITERATTIFERQEADNTEVNTETQINQNPDNNEKSNEESSQEADNEEINTEEEGANQEELLNEAQTQGDTATDGDVQSTNDTNTSPEQDNEVQPSTKPKPSKKQAKVKEEIIIVDDPAENQNANEKLTEKDNAEQEPDVAAIESEAETTESLTEPQTEEKLGQVQEKINEATDVENVEMSELSTDEESFQNRDGLNEDKVDEIVEKYNPSEFDPITYWVNEIGKKITLNHHRFAAAKKLGFNTIPASALTYPADHKKAGQVVPPSDRAEAIDFAKVRSNANRSMETPLERAKILRKKRENGDSKADLDAFKKNEGRNKTFIESLSFLNPKGLVVQALRAFETSTDVQNQREIEKISDWIGAARKRNKELTNAHEQELFNFLNNKDQSKRFRSKADFLSKVSAITGEMFFDPKKPLNISRFKNKSEGEKQYDKDIEEQKNKISDLENRKTEIKERLNNPANPQYINPKSSDYDQISKTSNKVLDKIEEDLRFERKKLQEIFQKKGKYTNAGSNQGGLFEDSFLKGLEDAEKQLKDFGDGTLGINLPVAIAIKAIQTVKLAYKAGKKAAIALQEGLDYIEDTDWYKSLTKKEKKEVTTDTLKQAIAEGSMTDQEAFDFVENNFDEADAAFENKLPGKTVRRKTVRKVIEKLTDRQYISKKLVDEVGAQQTKDAMINGHGSSGLAKRIFDKAYADIYTDKISVKVKGGFRIEFSPMSNADRVLLDKIIQLKRFIAIDKNRTSKGLPAVTHPGFTKGIIAQKYLNSLENKIGTEKFKDLEGRAKIYFDTYKTLLNQMLDNGLIGQKAFDSLNGLDYQPRLFLQHITDFEGNVSLGAAKKNSSDTGGLAQDQIKSLNKGSSGNLVRNSEWLLSTSIVSRQKAMSMNTTNRLFMTKEFPAAKKRFDALKKNIANRKKWSREDERFYNYFKELNSKIKDNPIIKTKENTDQLEIDGMVPEFIYKRKFKETPDNFKKAYYYKDGVRNEFFMEEELHNSWFDNLTGVLDPKVKEIASYISGSALLKGVATGNNPAFAITNTPRDFMFNVIFSDQYSSFVPKAMFQVTKDTFEAINEIRKSDGDFSGNSSNMLDNYIYYGGDMPFLSTQGRLKKYTILAKNLNKLVTPRVKSISGSAFRAVTLRKLSNYSEIMFRMALFSRTIKNELKKLGYKDISEINDLIDESTGNVIETKKERTKALYRRAVAEARSLLDFNQGGTQTKNAEALVPYINTAVQGTRVAVDAFQKNPTKVASKILQAGIMLSGAAVASSLALISVNKEEEDKDKSSAEIWLEAMEGISLHQRIQYVNIVDGTKNEDGEYRLWIIAKNQQLAPVLNIADNVYIQMMNEIAGKDRKSSKVNYAEAWTAIQNNIIPIDITSPITGNLTKIPLAKAALTYTTGYDFYRDQPLTFDQNQDIPEMEGAKDKNIEGFYRQIGRDSHLSPSRLKGSIESLITTPRTNPFIGGIYAGADSATADDKDINKIATDLGEDMLKSLTGRVIRYTSNFNRQVNKLRPIEGKLKNIKIKNAYREIDVEALASSFYNDEISVPAFIEALKGYAPKELDKVESKIKSIDKYKDIDRYVIGLAFENDREARALKIVQYYGDVFDGTAKNDKVFEQMLEMNIFDLETIGEYTKLMDKMKKDK